MQHYIDLNTSHPGRMAPNTALCFALCGLTLIVSSLRNFPSNPVSNDKNAWLGNIGAIIFSLGVVAFGGYVSGVETAYGWGALTKMAVHTAAGFIVIGVSFFLFAIIEHRKQDENHLPQWLPWPIALASLTITGAIWQAVNSYEAKLTDVLDDSFMHAGESLLLFGLIATLSLFISIRRQITQPESKLKMTGTYAPMVVIFLGILLALALYQVMDKNDRVNQKIRFDATAIEHGKSIEYGLSTYINTLYHIRSTYAASVHVSRDEFKRLTEWDLQRLPGILSLQWAPMVYHSERIVIERKESQRLGRPFNIREIYDQGVLLDAEKRDFYFPITYMEPFEKNLPVLGLDIATNPGGYNALKRVAEENRPSLSQRLDLLQTAKQEYGVVLSIPIFHHDKAIETASQRLVALKGFISAVFDIGFMIESILDKYTKPSGLNLTFLDMDGPPGERLLHYHSSRIKMANKSQSHFKLSVPVSLAGRNWFMTATPAPGAYANDWTFAKLSLPAFVIVAALILALYLRHSAGQASERNRLLSNLQNSQEALNYSQERFELAVRGSGDALWEYDSRTQVNWFSPRFLELLGYRADELPNNLETWLSHVHRDDLDNASEAFLSHLEDDVPYDIEYRMRTKQNDYHWFRARAKSLRDQHGKAYRTSGSVSDISQRKIAEQALEAERKQFETILNTSPVGSGITIGGQLYYVNQRLTEMMGVNVGDNVSSHYVDKEDRDHLIELLNCDDIVRDYEIEFLDTSGKIRNMLNTFYKIDYVQPLVVDESTPTDFSFC